MAHNLLDLAEHSEVGQMTGVVEGVRVAAVAADTAVVAATVVVCNTVDDSRWSVGRLLDVWQ